MARKRRASPGFKRRSKIAGEKVPNRAPVDQAGQTNRNKADVTLDKLRNDRGFTRSRVSSKRSPKK